MTPDALRAAHAAYRRAGADLPWLDDPARTHDCGMEGWFWRVVDPGAGRVLVVLCGLSRPPGGSPWSLVAVAGHPGGFVRWDRVDGGRGDASGFGVRAGALLDATDRGIRARLGDDTWVDLRLRAPLRVPAPSLGPAHVLPGLHQYWHAHLADGQADGAACLGGRLVRFDGARAYAEKNWGGRFASDWWWGQGFVGPDAAVGFAGGRLRLGRLHAAPTAIVLRLGAGVHRLVPPLARVTVATADGAWRVQASRPGLRLELEGDGRSSAPHLLPVPLGEARRVEPRSEHHLAARMQLSVRRGRRLLLHETTELAGLERGRPASPPGAPPG